MAAQDLQIIAPVHRQHATELYDLIGKVFSGGGFFHFRDICRNHYIEKSHYDWTASRIGIMNDCIVSHYGVWDYQMRIGGARVRVGGIGAVATHGDYRKRGLVSKLAWASIAAMRDTGYDMSLLFGIPNFYDRFGYRRAWANLTYKVKVSDLPETPLPGLRAFKPQQRRDLDRIYNRQYTRMTGTAVRPTYPVCSHRAVNGWEGVRWSNKGKRTGGYAFVRKVKEGEHTLQVFEYCGDADEALRAVATWARKRTCSTVEFSTLPFQSELAKLLRRGNCEAQIRFHRAGGAMVVLLNLESCLRKLAQELGRRLKVSPLADWRGDLLVTHGKDKVLLKTNRSRVKVAPAKASKHVIRGDDEMVQLLIGADDPWEIAEAGRMRVTGDAKHLLPVLFPNEHPVLSAWDGF